jgi:hypothetical protein
METFNNNVNRKILGNHGLNIRNPSNNTQNNVTVTEVSQSQFIDYEEEEEEEEEVVTIEYECESEDESEEASEEDIEEVTIDYDDNIVIVTKALKTPNRNEESYSKSNEKFKKEKYQNISKLDNSLNALNEEEDNLLSINFYIILKY